MGWLIAIFFCVLIAFWLLNILTFGKAKNISQEKPGQTLIGIIILAIIVFFALSLLGWLIGKH
jgi:hypothetical protein